MAASASSTAPRGPRQAVLLIHGIGSQRPGETLRRFVDAVLDPKGKPEETYRE